MVKGEDAIFECSVSEVSRSTLRKNDRNIVCCKKSGTIEKGGQVKKILIRC